MLCICRPVHLCGFESLMSSLYFPASNPSSALPHMHLSESQLHMQDDVQKKQAEAASKMESKVSFSWQNTSRLLVTILLKLCCCSVAFCWAGLMAAYCGRTSIMLSSSNRELSHAECSLLCYTRWACHALVHKKFKLYSLCPIKLHHMTASTIWLPPKALQ